MLELAKLLIETFILLKKDESSELIDKILQLLICILDGLHTGNHVTALTELSTQWAPIFEMRNKRYLACYFCMQFGCILILLVFF